jgi:hypothetical protein
MVARTTNRTPPAVINNGFRNPKSIFASLLIVRSNEVSPYKFPEVFLAGVLVFYISF